MAGSLYGKIEQRIYSVAEWRRKCIGQILDKVNLISGNAEKQKIFEK